VPEDIIIEEELGAYSFGATLDVAMDELIQITYHGEEIRLPYHVKGQAEGIVSELGWFLWVDGLPQPTRLETLDGDILKETAYMHNFALAFEERVDFYVVFSPISGNIGERIGLIAGALLRPDFMPDDVSNPIFDPFHHLSHTFPAEITVEYAPTNPSRRYKTANLQPILPEIVDMEKKRLQPGDTLESRLEEFVRIGIFPDDSDVKLNYEDIIVAKDGVARFSLFVYGGLDVTSRITFWVNHEPVQFNDVDFIDVQMEQGKMALIDIELKFLDLATFNSLYALMMTTNEDFHQQHMFKTWTLLLVNE